MIDNQQTMQFEDAENIGGRGEGETIQQAVMRQLTYCVKEGSKEMSGGGVKSRILNGERVDYYAPNQREIFINAVEMLWILVIPSYHKNREVIERQIKEIEEELEEIEKFGKKQLKNNSVRASVYGRGNYNATHSSLNMLNSSFQDKYEMQKVAAYRMKLVAISKLLDHINYFEEGAMVFD